MEARRKKLIASGVLFVLFFFIVLPTGIFSEIANSQRVSSLTYENSSLSHSALASVPELSWTKGSSFPIVKGRVMFPPMPQSVSPESYPTHWYAGSVFPSGNHGLSARSTCMTIEVPSSTPRSDEFYYVLVSTWTDTQSYVQIGFSADYGTWGLTYSWTSGSMNNPTYHFSPIAIALCLGTTYTFTITTQGGVTRFVANQGSNQIWSLSAYSGGNYLTLNDYTDYEEVWETSTLGGTPSFIFSFLSNYWTPTGQSGIPRMAVATTWTVFYDAAPSDVFVGINGSSVTITNGLFLGFHWSS